MTYTEWKRAYKYSVKRWPDVTSLYGNNEKCITVNIVHKEKNSNRWVVTEDKTEKWSPEHYMNCIDAIPFFKALGGTETVHKCYTRYGLIPCEIIGTSPDRVSRTIRTFIF